MAYEYEDKLINYLIGHTNVNPKYDGFEILKSIDELQEVYQKARLLDGIVISTKKRLSEQERKAKILDEVKNFITERLKEQKLTDEYDFGERLICEEIEDIIGGRVDENE